MRGRTCIMTIEFVLGMEDFQSLQHSITNKTGGQWRVSHVLGVRSARNKLDDAAKPYCPRDLT